MVHASKYHRVNPDDEVARLRDRRAAALTDRRLADVAEFTRQLDELYAELGSSRTSHRQAIDGGGWR